MKPRPGRRVVDCVKLALVFALVACGGSKPSTTGPTNAGSGSGTAVADIRTPIEKRRDAACEKVGAKLTDCALEDAKKDLAAGKVTKKEFDLNTAEGVLKRHTEKFVEQCEVPLSSRQVRVLEVCYQEEQQCGPLADCLTHLNDNVGK